MYSNVARLCRKSQCISSDWVGMHIPSKDKHQISHDLTSQLSSSFIQTTWTTVHRSQEQHMDSMKCPLTKTLILSHGTAKHAWSVEQQTVYPSSFYTLDSCQLGDFKFAHQTRACVCKCCAISLKWLPGWVWWGNQTHQLTLGSTPIWTNKIVYVYLEVRRACLTGLERSSSSNLPAVLSNAKLSTRWCNSWHIYAFALQPNHFSCGLQVSLCVFQSFFWHILLQYTRCLQTEHTSLPSRLQ